METFPFQPHGAHMGQIPHRQTRRQHLTQHGGDRCARHAPVKAENEQWVQHQIDSRARQRGDHGEAGAAVGANDGVQTLAEHIERYAQRDPEEVLFGQAEGFFIDRAAKKGQQRVPEQQIAGGQHKAGAHTAQHGAADASAGVLRLLAAQTKADEGTAAVADHHGHGQRDHRQGKHHRIGGVAVGAEVAGIGDEDLVDDIIQRRHQQRDHAGESVFPHQFGNGGGFQTGFFHG